MNAVEQEAVAARLQREAVRRLARKWRHYDDWEDILGEAYLAAWRAYTESRERRPTRDALGVAIKALEWGPAQWLRRIRWRPGREKPLSLDQMLHERGQSLHERWIPGLALEIQDRSLVEPDFSEGLLTQIMAADIPALLQQLPEPDRQALTLYYFEGLTCVEAARRMGCAERTFGYRLERALERCRVLAGLKPAPVAPATCRNGHPWSEATLATNSRGARVCRLCRNAAVRRYEARNRDRKRAKRATCLVAPEESPC